MALISIYLLDCYFLDFVKILSYLRNHDIYGRMFHPIFFFALFYHTRVSSEWTHYAKIIILADQIMFWIGGLEYQPILPYIFSYYISFINRITFFDFDSLYKITLNLRTSYHVPLLFFISISFHWFIDRIKFLTFFSVIKYTSAFFHLLIVTVASTFVSSLEIIFATFIANICNVWLSVMLLIYCTVGHR